MPSTQPRVASISSRPLAYGLAVVSVAVATAITLPLTGLIVHTRGLFLLVAIMLSAWYGGLGPGICASILSVLAFDYFFDQNPGVFDLSFDGGIRLLMGVAVCFFVTYLNAQRRKVLLELVATNKALENALEEIKTLRGILPICMHCKQIRNDEGLWEQIDHYLAAHIDAQFSHSVCPNCLRKLYPDVADNMERKRSNAERPSEG